MPNHLTDGDVPAAVATNPRAGETRPRVLGLDLMRSLAIICVVIVHAGWMTGHCDYPWITILNGVDLFFVLSGFLIGGIILRQLFDPERVGLRQVRLFYVSKISYSMYLVNLALVAQIIEKNATVANLTQAWLWYIVYWVAVILLSSVIYRFYEQPIMRLRDKFH